MFGLLDRKEFAVCLPQSMHDAKLIAIDGKALRRSVRKRPGQGTLHLVTAWSSNNGLTLAQAARDQKSDGITAIPKKAKRFACILGSNCLLQIFLQSQIDVETQGLTAS